MNHDIVGEEQIGTAYVIHCSCGFNAIGDSATEALQAFLDHEKSFERPADTTHMMCADVEMLQSLGIVYTLQELRNGTGFPKGMLFIGLAPEGTSASKEAPTL